MQYNKFDQYTRDSCILSIVQAEFYAMETISAL